MSVQQWLQEYSGSATEAWELSLIFIPELFFPFFL